MGARVPVPSGLRIQTIRTLLQDYDLTILGEYLEFGFPLNIDYSLFTFNTEVANHKSALFRDHGVDKYFKIEVVNFPLQKHMFLHL